MRFSRVLMAFGILAMFGSGCEDDVNILNPDELAPPLGLDSVTGDESVTLTWQASNYGEDRDGFYIYRALGDQSDDESPEEIPDAFGVEFVADVETTDPAGTFSHTVTGLQNGVTYSFLVVAYKNDGDDVSRPSNIIVDTPRLGDDALTVVLRPGVSAYLDVASDPPNPTLVNDTSEPGMSDVQSQTFDAGAGDRPGLVAINGARIQDKGYAASWDEVDEAPLSITSYPAEEFSVQALLNHVYVVRTADNHYAKLWVRAVDNGAPYAVTVSVAYQPQAGNNELDEDVPVERVP
jgi:hypothetical protein